MHKLGIRPSALDLRDPSNWENIALAKPGEEIRVMVRVTDNATAAKTPISHIVKRDRDVCPAISSSIVET